MPRTASPASVATRRVALIVESTFASGRGMFCGIADYARRHGPWSLCTEPRGLDDPVPSWLATWRGDGIIAKVSSRRLKDAVLQTGLPVVDMLGTVPDPRLPVVLPDDDAIGRLAAEHLLARGFHHFGHCGVRTNCSQRARAGFVAAVAVAGHEVHLHDLPVLGRSRRSWDADQERLAAWLRGLPKPVAIMASSDCKAQRVLDACSRIGVAVPDDVAVLGVGNDEMLCGFVTPPLSSIIPDFQRIGYEAARLLDRLMRGAVGRLQPLLLPPAGVVTRQSTDVIAVPDPETAAAVRFIRERACAGESVSVGEVAEHCLLSRTDLKRRFRRNLGCSVIDQILRERVNQATRLLHDTDLPIAHIARATGFRTQQRMGAVFRTRLGTTPARFRQQR